ncbi:hypothetical protein E3Q18_03719 [Wallemia mellicola]|nr:hypothetical protein E3Q18_03719 [Wallemia mellicola]
MADLVNIVKEYTPVLLSISKYCVVALIALNMNSFPLVWHFRTFGCVYWHKWFGNHERSVGIDPFKTVSTRKYIATIDDCDAFGFHLSNSSYAKNLDSARLDAWVELNYRLFKEAQVWTPLGASSYYFVKEIPFGKRYEIRTSIGAFEQDKWFYYVSKFVSKKSEKSKGSPSTPANLATAGSHATAPDTVSGTATPIAKGESPNSLIAQAYNELEPDEELNCIAITQYCFKSGRLTVPPPIALGLAGLGKNGEKNHEIFKNLVKERKLKAYLRGGYKKDNPDFADVELNINDLEITNSTRFEPYRAFTNALTSFKTH